MEKFSEDFVYKSIHSYDKKVKDELSMAKHYLKEYAGSRDQELDKNITEKFNKDLTNLEKKISLKFNVEGIVDNQKWENDSQA